MEVGSVECTKLDWRPLRSIPSQECEIRQAKVQQCQARNNGKLEADSVLGRRKCQFFDTNRNIRLRAAQSPSVSELQANFFCHGKNIICKFVQYRYSFVSFFPLLALLSLCVYIYIYKFTYVNINYVFAYLYIYMCIIQHPLREHSYYIV